MADAANKVQARIVWCQFQRRTAVTRDEEEGWQAEEAGLLDALYGVDRTEQWTNSSPFRVKRYQVGLRDGLALQAVMRLRQGSNRQRENAEGSDQVASAQQVGGADASASPSARSFRRAGS